MGLCQDKNGGYFLSFDGFYLASPTEVLTGIITKEKCLSLCLSEDNKKGCEFNPNDPDKGCFAYEKVVDKGDGTPGVTCWKFTDDKGECLYCPQIAISNGRRIYPFNKGLRIDGGGCTTPLLTR